MHHFHLVQLNDYYNITLKYLFEERSVEFTLQFGKAQGMLSNCKLWTVFYNSAFQIFGTFFLREYLFHYIHYDRLHALLLLSQLLNHFKLCHRKLVIHQDLELNERMSCKCYFTRKWTVVRYLSGKAQ